MSGLLLNGTPTKLTGLAGGTPVTITPDGFVWGDYTITAPDDGWYITGPHYALPLPALVPASTVTLEDKTFTPVYSGRYLVKVRATPSAGGAQVDITGVIEVTSGFLDEALPAPRERLEYDSDTGWGYGVTKYLSQLLAGLKHKVLRVHNNSGVLIAKNAVCRITSLSRYNGGGSALDLASDFPSETMYTVTAIDATNVVSLTEDVYLALENIADGATGLVLERGLTPYDTTALVAPDGPLYLTDAGLLDNAAGAGTYKRLLGFSRVDSTLEVLSSGAVGLIYFDGANKHYDSVRLGAALDITAADSPFAIGKGYDFIGVDTTLGLVQVSLPDTDLVGIDYEVIIKDIVGNASTNTITVVPSGSDSIEAAHTSVVLSTDWDSVIFRARYGRWEVVSGYNVLVDSFPTITTTTAVAAANISVSAIDSSGSPHPVGALEEIVICDSSTGPIVVNLPSIASVLDGTQVIIKDSNGSAPTNAITVNPNGTDQIELGGAGVGVVLDRDHHVLAIRADQSTNNWVIIENTAIPINYWLPVVPGGYPYGASAFEFVEADATGAPVQVDLPAVAAAGEQVIVTKIDGSGNAVTISGNGTNINGVATQQLFAQYDSMTLLRGTAQWWIV